MEQITQIQPFPGMVSGNHLPKRERKYKKPQKKESRSGGNRLFTLTRMADDTHQTLVMKNSPIRLCVYESNDDLLLDVVAIDHKNKENQHFSRSISDDKLPRLVKQIHTQRGLIFDYLI